MYGHQANGLTWDIGGRPLNGMVERDPCDTRVLHVFEFFMRFPIWVCGPSLPPLDHITSGVKRPHVDHGDGS